MHIPIFGFLLLCFVCAAYWHDKPAPRCNQPPHENETTIPGPQNA